MTGKHSGDSRDRSDCGRNHCHSHKRLSRRSQHCNRTWRLVLHNHNSEPEPRTRTSGPAPHIQQLLRISEPEPRTHIWEPEPHNHILVQRLHSRCHNHIS